MTDLFSDYDLNGLHLSNRMLMSAMTRTRATEAGVPTDLMRDYYVQRASAGLIVTECTQVSDQGHGIIRRPGLHCDDQIAGWRRVTDAVHAAGGPNLLPDLALRPRCTPRHARRRGADGSVTDPGHR